MPLVLQGASLNAGPLIAQQERLAEMERRAAQEAQQYNMGQQQQSLDAQGAGATLLRQQEALARQQEAQNYARQQDVLQNQRSDRQFQRQDDWRNENQQQAGLAFQRQGDWHAEELARKAAEQIQKDEQFKLRQQQARDLAEGNMQAADARGIQTRRNPIIQDLAKHVPTMDANVRDSLVKKLSLEDMTPYPEDTWAVDDTPVIQRDPVKQGAVDYETARNKPNVDRMDIANRRLDIQEGTAEERARKNQEDMAYKKTKDAQAVEFRRTELANAAKRLEYQQHPEKQHLDLFTADLAQMPPEAQLPYLQYENAKARGVLLPEGTNPLQTAELAEFQAGLPKDMIGNPVGDARIAWKRHYESQMSVPKATALRQLLSQMPQQAPAQPAPVQQAPAPPPKGVTTAAAGANPVTATGGQPTIQNVKTAEDYNRLPSGAEYIDPDGNHRKKP